MVALHTLPSFTIIKSLILFISHSLFISLSLSVLSMETLPKHAREHTYTHTAMLFIQTLEVLFASQTCFKAVCCKFSKIYYSYFTSCFCDSVNSTCLVRDSGEERNSSVVTCQFPTKISNFRVDLYHDNGKVLLLLYDIVM